MLEHTRKRRIDRASAEVRFIGPVAGIARLRELAVEAPGTVPWRAAFPEFAGNEAGTCLRGARGKEDVTQRQLAVLTGIPQRHISEMENGKRVIGKETARRLAKALKIDYRVFL
jgi:DNA-binding XRE family transcriptional regulator